jgi:uncharacterized protein HemX
VNRNPLMLTALVGAVLGVGLGGSSYHRPRQFTLDEEEAQSARRMLNRARARRRQTERERRREEERLAADEAARIEAARPKSRQELRAKARKQAKRLRPDRCFQKGERRP